MKVAVIGAGAWGTAMAVHGCRQGLEVVLAPRREEHAEQMRGARENTEYLAGFPLPPSLAVEADLATAVAAAELVLLATPSRGLREVCGRLRPALEASPGDRLLLSLSKGLEPETDARPSEIIADVVGRGAGPAGAVAVGCLTGPSFAGEVAAGKPTALTLAAEGGLDELVGAAQRELSSESLRVYRNEDLLGSELGGCLKNVYAIGAGCCDGLALGDNAKSAYLTRALAEMARLAVGLGAQAETIYGLAGFGDLVATSFGSWSRNRTFGEKIGAGMSVADVIASSTRTVEGCHTTKCFHEECRQADIRAPILGELFAVLSEDKSPDRALRDLMCGPLRTE